MNFRQIAILGGDKRQLFAAARLEESGFHVYSAGFDRLESFGNLRLCSVDEALSLCDVVLLPVTGAKGGEVVCPFSNKNIMLEDIAQGLRDKLVFAGKAESFKGIDVIDILKDESFSEKNALPTAEGALLTAMENYEGDIAGCDALVIGYGRIGKTLSRLLRAVKARVSVSTRGEEKAEKIILDGNTPLSTSSLKTLSGYDIVFNTADALVIDGNILMNTDGDPLIIDLASIPGGVDFKSARELGFCVIHALALPARYSPLSAGRAVSDTVIKKLKEEFNWQA